MNEKIINEKHMFWIAVEFMLGVCAIILLVTYVYIYIDTHTHNKIPLYIMIVVIILFFILHYYNNKRELSESREKTKNGESQSAG